MQKVDVYLEVGKKKTFAGAIEWPGWCRSAPDQGSALQALCEYGLRYAAVLHSTDLAFQPPLDVSDLTVIELLKGDASTDFGAPGKIPSADAKTVSEAELDRLQVLLDACWQYLDAAAQSAAGKELRKGPRGGGRDLDKIIQHVLDAETAYLRRLGYKARTQADVGTTGAIHQVRESVRSALALAVRGELPAAGPRGGARWPARYYVRRSAWHILDHAWEIEDRII